MKKIILIFLVLFMSVFTNSCELLEQVGEVERFVQCDFVLTGVRVTEISGVDFSHVKSASDLGLAELMTLGQRLFNKSLPAKLEVNVRARNSNSKPARISGMGWKVFMDESEFVGGQLNRSVEVLPNNSTNFPIVVEVDLIQMLHQESLPKLLNIVFGMSDNTKLRELGLSVKIKPSYKLPSGSVREFPSWITIRP